MDDDLVPASSGVPQDLTAGPSAPTPAPATDMAPASSGALSSQEQETFRTQGEKEDEHKRAADLLSRHAQKSAQDKNLPWQDQKYRDSTVRKEFEDQGFKHIKWEGDNGGAALYDQIGANAQDWQRKVDLVKEHFGREVPDYKKGDASNSILGMARIGGAVPPSPTQSGNFYAEWDKQFPGQAYPHELINQINQRTPEQQKIHEAEMEAARSPELDWGDKAIGRTANFLGLLGNAPGEAPVQMPGGGQYSKEAGGERNFLGLNAGSNSNVGNYFNRSTTGTIGEIYNAVTGYDAQKNIAAGKGSAEDYTALAKQQFAQKEDKEASMGQWALGQAMGVPLLGVELMSGQSAYQGLKLGLKTGLSMASKKTLAKATAKLVAEGVAKDVAEQTVKKAAIAQAANIVAENTTKATEMYAKSSLAAKAGRYALNTAGGTALMPSFYISPLIHKNIEQGRDPLDVRNLPNAFALGVAQNAVLGGANSLSGKVVTGTGLKATVGRIGVAAVSANPAMAATNVITSAAGLDTGYGIVGQLARGENGDALKGAVHSMMIFGTFAAMHGGEPAKVQDSFKEQSQVLAKQGVSPEEAGKQLFEPMNFATQLLRDNPNISPADMQAKIEEKFPGQKFAKAIGEVFPDKNNVPPVPEPGKEAAATPEPPKAPEGQLVTNPVEDESQKPGIQPTQMTDVARKMAQQQYDKVLQIDLGEDQALEFVRKRFPNWSPEKAPPSPSAAPGEANAPEAVPNDREGPNPQPQARQRFLDPQEIASEGLKKDFPNWSPEQIEAHKQKYNISQPDAVTGLIPDLGVRNASLDRAVQHVQKTGEKGAFSDIDLDNLGGINKEMGSNSAADKVYRYFAQIIKEEVSKVGGDVSLYRHGGDEMSAIGVNVDSTTLKVALEKARARIADYASTHKTPKGQLLSEINHPKHPGEEAYKGTGIHIGVTDIVPERNGKETVKAAEEQTAKAKEAKGEYPGVERRTTAKAGAVPSEGQAPGVEPGTGPKDRGAEGEGAKPTGSVDQGAAEPGRPGASQPPEKVGRPEGQPAAEESTRPEGKPVEPTQLSKHHEDFLARHKASMDAMPTRSEGVLPSIIGGVRKLFGSDVSLSASEKASDQADMRDVVSRIPDAAMQRINGNIKKIRTFKSIEDLTAAIDKEYPSGLAQTAKNHVFTAGAYMHGNGELWVNGPHEQAADVFNKGGRENAHETYAHDLGHALDYSKVGAKNKFSSTKNWQDICKEEIYGKLSGIADASHYAPEVRAAKGASEGFAEFCRLLYGTKVPTEAIKAKYPKAYEFFRENGLLPKGTEPAGGNPAEPMSSGKPQLATTPVEPPVEKPVPVETPTAKAKPEQPLSDEALSQEMDRISGIKKKSKQKAAIAALRKTFADHPYAELMIDQLQEQIKESKGNIGIRETALGGGIARGEAAPPEELLRSLEEADVPEKQKTDLRNILKGDTLEAAGVKRGITRQAVQLSSNKALKALKEKDPVSWAHFNDVQSILGHVQVVQARAMAGSPTLNGDFLKDAKDAAVDGDEEVEGELADLAKLMRQVSEGKLKSLMVGASEAKKQDIMNRFLEEERQLQQEFLEHAKSISASDPERGPKLAEAVRSILGGVLHQGDQVAPGANPQPSPGNPPTQGDTVPAVAPGTSPQAAGGELKEPKESDFKDEGDYFHAKKQFDLQQELKGKPTWEKANAAGRAEIMRSAMMYTEQETIKGAVQEALADYSPPTGVESSSGEPGQPRQVGGPEPAKPVEDVGKSLLNQIIHEEAGTLFVATSRQWLVDTGQRVIRTCKYIADGLARLAGHQFPTLTRLARSAGEATARAASVDFWSRSAAAELNDKVFDGPNQGLKRVLFGPGHTAEFRTRVFATDGETRLRETKDMYLAEQQKQLALAANAKDAVGFNAAHKAAKEAGDEAASIPTFIGGNNSPLLTEADYQTALKDPEVTAARARYENEVVPIMESNYRRYKGMSDMEDIDNPTQMKGKFGQQNHPINFLPLEEGATPTDTTGQLALPGGGLKGLRQKGMGFTKHAKFSADAYEMDYGKVIENSIIKGSKAAAESDMYRELLRVRLAQRGFPGEKVVFEDGTVGKELPGTNFPDAARMENAPPLAPPEKGQTSLFVHPDVFKEVHNAKNLEEPEGAMAVTKAVMGVATQAALASSVEAVSHSANLARSLFAPDMINGRLLSNAWGKLTGNSYFREKITELARIGARNPTGLESGTLVGAAEKILGVLKGREISLGSAHLLDPTFYMSKFMHGLSDVIRVSLADAYEAQAARSGIEVSETNKRNFINEWTGNYNRKSQPSYIRFLRDTGIGSFATATTTQMVRTTKTLFGSPGLKTTSWGKEIEMRARVISKLVAVAGAVAAYNYLKWGRVDGDDDAPFLSVKLGNGDDGKGRYLDLGSLVGIKRGLRSIGMLNHLSPGDKTTGQGMDSSFGEIMHSLTHPAMGPGPTFLWTMATGENTLGRKIAPQVAASNEKVSTVAKSGKLNYGSSQKWQNAKTALANANPLIANLTGADKAPNEEPASTEEKVMKMFGPFGLKYQTTPKKKGLSRQ